MNWVDLTLNMVGLLLCLHWSLAGLPDVPLAAGVSITSNLRRAAATSPHRWPAALALAILIGGRAVFYWLLGPNLDWVPTLPVGPLALHVRSQSPGSMAFYSIASFALALGTAYVWLLLLGIVNRSLPESDPGQRIVRHLLGPPARLPWIAQLLIPPLGVGLGWFGLAQLLPHAGLLPQTPAPDLARQSLALALWSWLGCRDLLLALLLIGFVNSHVYLGNLPIWHFIAVTCRHLLRPLRFPGLVWGRIDLAPLIGMGLVLAAAHWASQGLTWLYFHPVR